MRALFPTDIIDIDPLIIMTMQAIFGLFGYNTSSSLTASVSQEELKLMLKGAEHSGAIEGEENDMIENVLDLEDTSVDQVMTPLFNLVAVERYVTILKLFYTCRQNLTLKSVLNGLFILPSNYHLNSFDEH